MFRPIRIGKFNLIGRFGEWFWTMSDKDAFLSFVIVSFTLTCILVPGFAYTIWSNSLISGVVIVEMLYLEYWKDRRRKPTKSERLEKENVNFGKTVDMQKLMLEQKMDTIVNLIYENRRLRGVVTV